MAVAISSGIANSVLNYIIYAISFYAVCILTAFVIKNGKNGFKSLKGKIFKTKYGNRFMTDIGYRTSAMLYFSILFNVANVLLNVVYGIVYGTNWFFVLSFYYAKYTPPTQSEDKMTRLRRRDASVTNTASVVALVFGVIGILVLGFGMSLIMTDISSILGSYKDMAMVIGIATGICGGALASLAYPIYNVIVKAKRKKIAP